MSGALTLWRAGPATSVQDLGRPGHIRVGLSPGGAMDPLALAEAAVLLGLKQPAAALEFAGMGPRVSVDQPTRIALTGGAFDARLDGQSLAWNRTVGLKPGQVLDIRGALDGVYGYVTLPGGFDMAPWQGSQSAHLVAGIGAWLCDDQTLPFGRDPAAGLPPQRLRPDARFSGGTLRVAPGPQTDLFGADVQARFVATRFRKSPRANRQGIALEHDGAGFFSDQASDLASDFIVTGDIQMTGDGTPYVLMSECQTIGGYPRIGTVVAADLPRLAQCQAGQELRFEMLTTQEADAIAAPRRAEIAERLEPMLRDPHDIADLLGYQLIDGVISGREPQE